MNYRILSLNTCLGVFNKIDLLEQWKNDLKPDLIFLQECEISKYNLPHVKLTKFNLFVNQEQTKARSCLFVNSRILNDVKVKISNTTETIIANTPNCQIVGLYRPFKLNHHNNHANYIEDVISLLERELDFNKKVLIVGDINLDFNKVTCQNYAHRKIYDTWLSFIDRNGLTQNINIPTWSRIIRNTKKESILDHCYSNTTDLRCDVLDLMIGDHKALFIAGDKPKTNKTSNDLKRNWKRYSQSRLRELLVDVCWERFNYMTIEQASDFLDIEIMSALSKIAPEKVIKQHERKFAWSDRLLSIKRKKKNLLKKARRKNSPELFKRANSLDKVFKATLIDEKRKKLRTNIKKGDQSSFWDAIKIAEDNYGQDDTPEFLHLGNIEANSNEAKASLFAKFFEEKILTLKKTCKDEDTHDGERLLYSEMENPFTPEKVTKAFLESKRKRSFGHDRIPMLVLLDAREIIIPTVCSIFQKIYEEKVIPSKWKISRIVALHKKGDKSSVENYRPISNVCSLAKIFERCILNEINTTANIDSIDISGVNQHGFKKGHSTSTLALDLQTHIAKALEKGKMVGVVSLDLTAAFDCISKPKLKTRLAKLGLDAKIVDIIDEWLVGRSSYVECNGCSSFPYKELYGTPQGSVLGPVLFTLYIRPLFDVTPNLKMYADDSYIFAESKDLKTLEMNIKEQVELTQDWLTKSGLVVNMSKTEYIVFKNKGQIESELRVKSESIKNKSTLNVLGITFDSNLKWTEQINKVIANAKKDCYRLRKLKRFFNTEEILGLLTTFVYSKMFYGSTIWLNPYINKSDRKRLMSISTYVIKNAFNLKDWYLISNKDIHELANRATPNMMSNYSSAVAFRSIMLNNVPQEIAKNIAASTITNVRSEKFYIQDRSIKRVGLNAFENRLKFVTNKLPLNWSSLSETSFKKLCKTIFLSY